MNSKTFSAKSFGCRVNLTETDYLISRFIEKKYKFVSWNENPDFLIINSCAVTKEAERQVFQFIRKIQRNFPTTKIILTGCLVDYYKGNIKKVDVDLIVSNYYKHKISDLLEKQEEKVFYKSIFNQNFFIDVIPKNFATTTRAFLKIQDGCNNYCSYCVINQLRGKPRSMPSEKVICNILHLQKKGIKEVILCGINLGIYGKDLSENIKLLDLLEKIEEALIEKNIENFRIRLSSIKPDEINGEFINFFKNSNFFCKHIHFSIQNFNDHILMKMKRNYKYATIKNCVTKLKEEIPLIGIGCDIITGFPGETIDIFEDNLKKIEELEIDFFHIFPFSKRENTKAFYLREEPFKDEKKRRVTILKNIAKEKKINFFSKNLNVLTKVLFEAKINDYWYGYTDNYIRVYIKSKKNFKNYLINVKLKKLFKEGISGLII